MTGHGDVPLAVEAMKLGAIDFLEKPFEDDRLIAMVEAALRAERGSKSEALRPRSPPAATVSQRERQVMHGLVTGLSNKSIAREYDISPRTVEVYRANVMTKMQAGNLSRTHPAGHPGQRVEVETSQVGDCPRVYFVGIIDSSEPAPAGEASDQPSAKESDELRRR